MDGARGKRDGGGGCEFADGFGVEFEDSAGGGEIGFGGGGSQVEGVEGAVDVASGADALDDLLAEIAAFGEVEGAGSVPVSWGSSLSRMSAAVEGCAFEDAEVFQGFLIDRGCGDRGEGFGELRNSVGGFGQSSKRGTSGLWA